MKLPPRLARLETSMTATAQPREVGCAPKMKTIQTSGRVGNPVPSTSMIDDERDEHARVAQVGERLYDVLADHAGVLRAASDSYSSFSITAVFLMSCSSARSLRPRDQRRSEPVVVEEEAELPCEIVVVLGLEAVPAVSDPLLVDRDVPDEQRAAAAGRLEHDVPVALGPRREDEHIGRGVDADDLLERDMPRERARCPGRSLSRASSRRTSDSPTQTNLTSFRSWNLEAMFTNVSTPFRGSSGRR